MLVAQCGRGKPIFGIHQAGSKWKSNWYKLYRSDRAHVK